MKIFWVLKCSYLSTSYRTYTKKMISNEENLLASVPDYCRNRLRDLPVSILALHCPQPLTSSKVYVNTASQLTQSSA